MDNHESFSVANSAHGIAIDGNDYIFLGVDSTIAFDYNAQAIAKYNTNGDKITQFGNFKSIYSMIFDRLGNLIVLDSEKCYIYDSNLNIKTNFSVSVARGTSLALDNSNNIYIGKIYDSYYKEAYINVYNSGGFLITNYNKQTIVSYKGPHFPNPVGAGSGSLYDIAWCSYSENGLVIYKRWSNPFSMYDEDSKKFIFETETSSWIGSSAAFFKGSTDIAIYNSSFGTNRGNVKILRNNYYGKDIALNRVPPPHPLIIGQSQRAGTTYLDIDYKVIAATNTPVKVGMLAFVNGQTNLNSIIIPKTFVDGTDANLGANILPNTTKRVTWDMGRDWSTNVGTVQIEILANDGRPLQPQMWTNNPANLPAKLTGAVTDTWSMWLWLLATRDPRVTLVNGNILGVNGNYVGKTLCASLNSTLAGSPYYIYNPNVSVSDRLYKITTTQDGQQFLQEIVDSQAPLIR